MAVAGHQSYRERQYKTKTDRSHMMKVRGLVGKSADSYFPEQREEKLRM